MKTRDRLDQARRQRVSIKPAYRKRAKLLTWCKHCRLWHAYPARSAPGKADGFRPARCECPRSPYRPRGVYLREVGPFGDEQRGDHQRARDLRRRNIEEGRPGCACGGPGDEPDEEVAS